MGEPVRISPIHRQCHSFSQKYTSDLVPALPPACPCQHSFMASSLVFSFAASKSVLQLDLDVLKVLSDHVILLLKNASVVSHCVWKQPHNMTDPHTMISSQNPTPSSSLLSPACSPSSSRSDLVSIPPVAKVSYDALLHASLCVHSSRAGSFGCF